MQVENVIKFKMEKKIKTFIILIMLIVSLIAVYVFYSIQERVSFKDVEIEFYSIEIKGIDLKQMTLNLNLNLKCFNPNKIPAVLDGAEYEIYIQNIYIGNGSVSEKITIPPQETKIIKSEANVKYKDLKSLMNAVNEIIKNEGETEIMLKGNVYLDIGIKIKIPFKVEKKITLSEEIIEKIKNLKGTFSFQETKFNFVH